MSIFSLLTRSRAARQLRGRPAASCDLLEQPACQARGVQQAAGWIRQQQQQQQQQPQRQLM